MCKIHLWLVLILVTRSLRLILHVDGGLARKSQCSVDLKYNLYCWKKIQDERKSRIRNVCDMCRRNRTSMECNHVTMDEDYRSKIVYKNLLVNDKHKVSKAMAFVLCYVSLFDGRTLEGFSQRS